MAPRVEHISLQGGPAVRLWANDGSQATVLLHGAQVLSWIDAHGVQRLYLSPLAALDASQAVRGGIPVIFPQFAARGSGPRHGFARTSAWALGKNGVQNNSAQVTLNLNANARTHALWPHDFACELQVTLSAGRLCVRLDVINPGTTSLTFAAALHSYLNVGALASVALKGLQNRRYEDAHQPEVMQTERRSALVVRTPLDRVYADVLNPLHLSSATGQLSVRAQGFPDVVVWNPGLALSASLADLPAGDFEQFLCVEAAAVHRPVRLAGGRRWGASQTLEVLNDSGALG